MAETFTFDELSKPEDAQDHSYDSLSQPEPESFTFENLSKPQTPEVDLSQYSTRTVSIPKIGAVQVADIPRPQAEFATTEKNVNEPTFNLGNFLIKGPGEANSPVEEGVNTTLRNTLNELTTPKNIGLMLGSLGIASTGQAAKLLVSALWANAMGTQAIQNAPDKISKVKEGIDNGDYKKVAENLSSLGVDTFFTVAPALHAVESAKGLTPQSDITTTGENQNAIQEQSPNAEMLRQPQSKVGLSRVGEGNAQPQEVARPQEEVPIQQAPEAGQARVLLTGEPPAQPPPSVGRGIAGSVRAKWADATATDFPGSEAGFINIEPLVETLQGLGRGVKASIEAVKEIGKEAFYPKRMTDYRRSVLSWSSKLQRSFNEAGQAQRDINKEVPDPVRREGITNWIQADGDAAVLKARAAATTDPKLKRGYEAALTLTPGEIGIANDIRNTFDTLAARGQVHNILNSFKDNYVPQMWDLGKSKGGAGSRTLRDRFKFSRARTFDTYFDGEQAGFVPKTKDISKILPVYIHEMNSVIAARQLVMDMSKGVASDGRPLLVPRGAGIPVEGESGKATLIAPKAIKGETGDYKTLEGQPAMSGWRWASKDSAGKDVFLKSDLAIHPEVYDKIKNVLGKSAIKEWYNSEGTRASAIPKALVKFIDIAQGETKKTMLGLLSPFHQVQEGTHAVGHKVNPNPFFDNIPKIDLVRDAGQIDATRHGLMLLPDRATESSFMEGFKNSTLISKIPGIGKLADRYAHYTFEEYIPGLKYKTYQAILARNMEVFKKQLASGKIKAEDVKVISAEQSNAAYGHLNYADLGRNPTIQHLARMFLLAPDFLEARARFTAQGAKGLTGAKVGREQFIALGTLAFAQGMGAYLIAKAIGGQWDYKDPFSVRLGNRKYTMRSVPEDMVKLGIDPRMFVRSRLSPLIGRGLLDYTTGRNWKDEKVSALETTKDLAKEPIPMTLRAVLGMGGTSIKPMEQLAGAAGLKISKVPNEKAVYYAKVNEAIDTLARKAKQLPRNERQRFMMEELRKQGYWDHHAKTRIGRMYPGLYKYDNRND